LPQRAASCRLPLRNSAGLDRRRFAELPDDLRAWPERRGVVEFIEVLLKACARDPAQCYQSGDEMQRDLTRSEVDGGFP